MWKVLVSSAVLALSDSPPGSLTEEQRQLYVLGVTVGMFAEGYVPSPGELEQFRAGLHSQVKGGGQPVDMETLARHAKELRALKQQRTLAREKQRSAAFLEKVAKEQGAVRLESGVIFRNLKEGTGDAPGTTGKVRLRYDASLADGTQVDSLSTGGLAEWMELDSGEGLRCLWEGVRKMRVGGHARVVCPAELAADELAVPRGALLVFEVRLLEVKTGAESAREDAGPPPVYRQVDLPAEAPSFGPKDAKVTLVVWCGFHSSCGRFFRDAKGLLEEDPRDLRLVLRFYVRPHEFAEALRAEAALAAHEQGRFWDYLDLLPMQGSMGGESHGMFYDLAEKLGLDRARFQEALGLRRFRSHVEADFAAGEALGIGAFPSISHVTPAMFINGREYQGYHKPFLKKLIAEEKARAERLLAAGTPPGQLYARLIEGGLQPAPLKALPAPPALFDVRHSPSRGPETAPVTVVTFLRFSHPDSVNTAATLRMVEEEYAGKVRFIFKNRPHTDAPAERLVALATLAAHEQGRFWDYHDRLLSHPAQLDRKGLVAHARALGLDVARFEQALDSGRLKPQLEVDLQEANWLETGDYRFSASTFINRRKMREPASITELRQLINEELEKAGVDR